MAWINKDNEFFYSKYLYLLSNIKQKKGFILNVTVFHNRLKFVKSVITMSNRSSKVHFEVAVTGYSNTGKSSAINLLANYKKKYVRVSKTPGRTQTFNIFEIFSDYQIIDLPGYGYSNVSKQMKMYWNKTIFRYLMFRKYLKGLVLCMDIRYPIKIFDEKVLRIAIKKK